MKKQLEKDMLQYGIVVSITYQLYQSLLSLVPTFQPFMAFLNMFIVMVLFFIYLLIQKKGPLPVLIFLLHTLALGGFTYFYKNFGGLSGTVPSLMCAYTAFIMVCSHGGFRVFLVATMMLMLTVFLVFPEALGMTAVMEPSKIPVDQRAVDFLVVAVIIVIFTLYMKKKLQFYKNETEHRYQQLDQIAQTLHVQNQELATRQEETRAINDNLESMAEERTREVENKNRELAEYAFINAHMLRGPLCRIIGLINLMEKEPDQYPMAELRQLKLTAQDIDKRIKEIDSVIS
jgi:glucan phosphoethanolaminetransferase (alkaline phosphatase superfamily)